MLILLVLVRQMLLVHKSEVLVVLQYNMEQLHHQLIIDHIIYLPKETIMIVILYIQILLKYN